MDEEEATRHWTEREGAVSKLKKEKPSSSTGWLFPSPEPEWQPGPRVFPPQRLESLWISLTPLVTAGPWLEHPLLSPFPLHTDHSPPRGEQPQAVALHPSTSTQGFSQVAEGKEAFSSPQLLAKRLFPSAFPGTDETVIEGGWCILGSRQAGKPRWRGVSIPKYLLPLLRGFGESCHGSWGCREGWVWRAMGQERSCTGLLDFLPVLGQASEALLRCGPCKRGKSLRGHGLPTPASSQG